MLRAQRQAKILQIVRERGFVENDELANMFNVTPTTIRRDIKELNKQNLIHIDHGGLSVLDYLGEYVEPEYETKMYVHLEKKKAIARAAVEKIKDGDTVILDSGTTNLQIAKALKHQKYKGITVVTCDLKAAGELCCEENVNVIVLGGILRTAYYSTYGPYAEYVLKQMKADKLFLGIDAASIAFGVTNVVLEEVPIKQLSIQISKEVYMVADSTKFGAEVPYRVCSWDDIDGIITDKEVSEEYKTFFENSGINSTFANVKN